MKTRAQIMAEMKAIQRKAQNSRYEADRVRARKLITNLKIELESAR